MPSRVEGERRLRGIQPVGNFVVRAAFWICQGEGPVRGLGGSGDGVLVLVELEGY